MQRFCKPFAAFVLASGLLGGPLLAQQPFSVNPLTQDPAVRVTLEDLARWLRVVRPLEAALRPVAAFFVVGLDDDRRLGEVLLADVFFAEAFFAEAFFADLDLGGLA